MMGLRTLVSLLLVVKLAAGQSCYPPLVEVSGICIYISEDIKTWAEARAHCQGLLVQTGTPDLLTFDSCDDFIVFAGYMGFNVPADSSFWVGAHTEFGGNTWRWVNGEPLSTGVPFWAHMEGHDDGQECAAIDSNYYFKLTDQNCDEQRRYVCGAPATSKTISKPKNATVRLSCPSDTLQVGDNCYYFSDRHVTWTSGEDHCHTKFYHNKGSLFSPATCDEFAHMAHHLEVTEDFEDRWIGAADVTGNHEWFWSNGNLVPGGPPYWAADEPNHPSDGQPRTQAAVMSSSKRFYLEDSPVDEYRLYICKVNSQA